MPQKVLNEDWSAYDDRKIRDKRDSKDFACSESWEVDHLINVTRKAYPLYSESQIKSAIGFCCAKVGSPHPRNEFVACVMNRLRS
jgi:hypothetical protein